MLQYWRDSSISTTREHESFCEASEWQSADEIPTRDIEFPFNNGIPTYNKTNLFSVEHVHTSSDADARFVCEASNPWDIMGKNWGTRPDIANGTSKRVSYLGSMFSTSKEKKGGGGWSYVYVRAARKRNRFNKQMKRREQRGSFRRKFSPLYKTGREYPDNTRGN